MKLSLFILISYLKMRSLCNFFAFMLIWFLIQWRHDFDMRLTENLKYACNVNYVGGNF